MTTDKTHKDENLTILSLEDSTRDFELIKELLIDAGYTLTIERVETEDAFAASLSDQAWDFILADFKLPGFDAFGALRLRNKICPDTPFICVSGSIGEETAIELLKSGAVDYVLKDRPDRLPFAVGRALDEAREKKIRQQNDEALKEAYRQLKASQAATLSILEDLKAEVRARQAKEADRQKFLQLAESSSDFIGMCDLDMNPLYVNPAGQRMVGFPDMAAACRVKVQDYYFPEDQRFITEEFFPRVLREGHGDVEIRLRHFQTGEPIWMSYYLFSVKDFSGTPIGWATVSRDITDQRAAKEEREKLQAQLNHAQKMEAIGVLAGGIAHDFNNILFPIVGHTEMLLEDIPLESPFRNSLNQILSGSLRATALVQQILSFSRQEKSELAMMKMQPIIKEALKLIRSTIPATISINQSLQSSCGPVKADPTQIHQIVMNLSTNAYHAMAENGGELKISLKEVKLSKGELTTSDMIPGSYACLTVSDTGIGMDKDVMNKIFDPFFTTKEKGRGTGMGLSVVHGIVTSMNGAIQVNSEPGIGTEFHIYLPVVGNLSEKKRSPITEPSPGGSERILLVDDEAAIIAMEKQILERLGYHVVSCAGSIEALEVFRSGPDQYDLVITDMSMPIMSGDKLAAELLKIRPDIPIMLCTGFIEKLSEEKAKLLGIKGFLMKPIVIKDLAKKIRELFG